MDKRQTTQRQWLQESEGRRVEIMLCDGSKIVGGLKDSDDSVVVIMELPADCAFWQERLIYKKQIFSISRGSGEKVKEDE